MYSYISLSKFNSIVYELYTFCMHAIVFFLTCMCEPPLFSMISGSAPDSECVWLCYASLRRHRKKEIPGEVYEVKEISDKDHSPIALNPAAKTSTGLPINTTKPPHVTVSSEDKGTTPLSTTPPLQGSHHSTIHDHVNLEGVTPASPTSLPIKAPIQYLLRTKELHPSLLHLHRQGSNHSTIHDHVNLEGVTPASPTSLPINTTKPPHTVSSEDKGTIPLSTTPPLQGSHHSTIHDHVNLEGVTPASPTSKTLDHRESRGDGPPDNSPENNHPASLAPQQPKRRKLSNTSSNIS